MTRPESDEKVVQHAHARYTVFAGSERFETADVRLAEAIAVICADMGISTALDNGDGRIRLVEEHFDTVEV